MPIEWHWQGATLPDLIERLKQQGFKLTTSETLDATRLVLQLSRTVSGELTAEALRNHLKPLLCKVSDPEIQRRFDEVFEAWRQSPPRATIEEAPTAVLTKRKSQDIQASPPTKSHWLNKKYVFALVIVGLISFLAYFGYQSSGREISTKNIIVNNSDSSNIVEKPIQPKQDTGQRIYGYWPAYRYYTALKPELAWLLTGLPLSLLVLVHFPAMVLSRRRGYYNGQIRLDGWGKDLTAERLVAPLPETIAGQFNRHFRGPANERRLLARRPAINLHRTVEATLKHLGIPQLCYRHARLRPSYLVLVEAKENELLPVLWAQRLQQLGIDADIRQFSRDKSGNVPVCRPVGGTTSSVTSFTNLPNPPLGQRLMLVSDGGFLLDQDGDWKPWALAAKLERWPVRVLFSPREPRDLLSGRLHKLDSGVRPNDPGFLVLPQEESALAAWSTWLATGHFPRLVLAEAQRFPRSINEQGEAYYLKEFEEFTPEQRPASDEINRLVSELNIYLGENGFYWLCCCAVPPTMDAKLTLLLGEEYLKRAGVTTENGLRKHLQQNYRLLARLPWLRHNHIPDWLRLAFLSRLSTSLQQEIRDAVEGLLARQNPNEQGDLTLHFGLPDTETDPNGSSSESKDALYIGFMKGLSAQELTLRMPGEWQRWLGSLRTGGKQPNRVKAWLTAVADRLLFKQGFREFGAAAKTQWFAGSIVLAISGMFVALAYLPIKTWPGALHHLLLSDQNQPLIVDNQSKVNSVAFSPDGQRLVSGSDDKTLRLWDAATGKAIGLPFKGHEGYVNSVAFSPDGQRIVSGSDDKTLRLWDVNTGKAIGPPLTGHEDVVTSVAFSPDGQRIVSGSWDKTLRLWDADTGKPVGQPLAGHEGSVYSVAFSRDGRRIVSGSRDNTLRLWDAATGKPIIQFFAGDAGSVTSVAFSPDGRRIVSGSYDNTLRLWDATTGKAVGQPFTGHEGSISWVAFSRDGKFIVSSSVDKTLRLWDAATGKAIGPPLTGHEDVVTSVAFSPDGQRIVSGSSDKTLRLWDAATGKAIGPPLTGHEDYVYSVAFSPDGQRIVSSSYDKTLRLWDAATGKAIGPPLTGHEDVVTSVAFSPDGRRIVSGDGDKTLRLWDAATGKAIGPPLTGHEDVVTSVAFSPDGQRIVSGSDDKTLRLWDADTGKPVGQPLAGHEGSVYSVAFSRDGRRIVSGSRDKTLRLWDAATGKPIIQFFAGDAGSVTSVAFSPDGRRIVSGSYDKTLRLWDAATGKAIGLPLTGHGSGVSSVAFSPDGRRIVSGGWDKTLRLWDAQTGLEVGVIPTTDEVFSVQFSPRGDRILAGGGNINFIGEEGNINTSTMLMQWRIPPYPPDKVEALLGQWLQYGVLLTPILLVLLLQPLFFGYSLRKILNWQAVYRKNGLQTP